MISPYRGSNAAACVTLQPLYARGVTSAVINTFQIQSQDGGWIYPVPGSSVTRRWKNADSHASPKYKWVRKETCVQYYYALGIQDAIATAGGILYIVGGEPDVWAMHSADITNVLSWFGEAQVPISLAEDMAQWKVREVRIAPDLDDTGALFLRKIAKRLTNSDIRLVAYQLPTELGDKGDIGKAWEQHRDASTFENWLITLPPLDIPASPNDSDNGVANSRAVQSSSSAAEYRELPDDVIRAIEQALEVKGYKPNGYSKDLLCPFHDDHNPSAGWHRDKHVLHCFRCGKTFRAREVAEQLGLSWYSDKKPAILSRQRSDKNNKDLSSADTARAASTPSALPVYSSHVEPALSDRHGLPIELRLELLKCKQTSLARVLEMMTISGLRGGDHFSSKQALELGKRYGIGRNTIYSMLKAELIGPGGILSLVFTSISTTNTIRGEKGGKNRRGRPKKQYVMPSVEALCRRLRLNVTRLHYAPIALEALKSAKDYRIETYREFIKHHPGRYSRRELGDILGVSACTTRLYDEPAYVKATPQYKRTPVSKKDIDRYSGILHQQGPPAWFEDSDGNRYEFSGEGLTLAITFSKDHTAYHVVQTINHYAPASEQGGQVVEKLSKDMRDLQVLDNLRNLLDENNGLFS